MVRCLHCSKLEHRAAKIYSTVIKSIEEIHQGTYYTRAVELFTNHTLSIVIPA